MTSHEQQQFEDAPHQIGVDELHEELDTTPVHAAARAGQVEDLREILRVDAAQAVALDKYGLTPLHWACDRGEAAAARLLLQHGADVNAVEKRMFKRRPLHFAVLSSSEETVRELLAHHADVLAVDYRGWAPIHGAAYSGDVDSLTALLDAGASLTTQLTHRRETALHIAASQGRVDAAQLLLKRSSGSGGGADESLLEMEDDEGSTAAQVATRNGFKDVACLLA
ncbi:Ankyrin repeat and SOCS box protein 13 [Phytophthora citrophthora]|uniref:Ankyrin repeat and SOCS box protein 13 n=1 Tax=Phytophthora citrophthora TaxID=4793 RepID=A0AAD9GXN4_9STRA|nr:Ankyrin repeat and SOCS box protein 13 [Phytophthora citrophthora]KAK1946483.1 Ankyrin repeat and SOCS box protein 13 [Phytophthora citrophthora]